MKRETTREKKQEKKQNKSQEKNREMVQNLNKNAEQTSQERMTDGSGSGVCKEKTGSRKAGVRHSNVRLALTAAVLLGAAALSGCSAAGQATTASSGAGTATGTAASSAHSANVTSLPALADDAYDGQRVITAGGTARVLVTPDQAELVFGVVSQGKDAKTVKDQNTQDYNRVMDFLKQQGLSEEQIKTSNLGLDPIYDWSKGRQDLTGYSMETDITVSRVSLDQLGTLVDQAVNNGINSIQSVSYSSSSYDETYQEALKQAVTQARDKAQAMADAAGVTLGNAVNLTEYTPDANVNYAKSYSPMSAEAASADSSMDLQPGQIEIDADVNVVYAIQ